MPSRAEQVGLYTRALREALESAAGHERAAAVLTRALRSAAMVTVPEELEAFRRFSEGPLRKAVERQLEPAAVDAIFERIGHVLWMATSDVQSRREDADEASGARFVEGIPFRVPSLPSTPVPPRRVSSVPVASSPAVRSDEDADTAPIPTRRGVLAVKLARVTRPGSPPGGLVEIGPEDLEEDSYSRTRSALLEVCVLTLDPLLVFETDNGLAGRGRVREIGTVAELARCASATKGRLVVVVDSALPSIDLPTFAPISGSLPPGTRIILWGVDERQKQRLAAMFPPAKDWIASGRAASPAEVILDLELR